MTKSSPTPAPSTLHSATATLGHAEFEAVAQAQRAKIATDHGEIISILDAKRTQAEQAFAKANAAAAAELAHARRARHVICISVGLKALDATLGAFETDPSPVTAKAFAEAMRALAESKRRITGRPLDNEAVHALCDRVIASQPRSVEVFAAAAAWGGDLYQRASSALNALNAACLKPYAVQEQMTRLLELQCIIGDIGSRSGPRQEPEHASRTWDAHRHGYGPSIEAAGQARTTAVKQGMADTNAKYFAQARAVRRNDPEALAEASRTPGLVDAFKRMGAAILGEA